MKIFALATISALAFTSLTEAARTPNSKMQPLDCSINKEAPEDFVKCFYNKHGAAPVGVTIDEYKRVAMRISSALDRAGDNKQQQKRYVKSILIKNSNLFGQSKQDMKVLFDDNSQIIDEYVEMVKMNVNVEEAKKYLASLQNATVEDLEKKALTMIKEQINQYKDHLPSGFDDIDVNSVINEFENSVKENPEVEAFLKKNSGKSVSDLITGAIEEYKVKERISGLEKDLSNKLKQ